MTAIRRTRRTMWIPFLILAVIFGVVMPMIADRFFIKKETVTLCASERMKSAFQNSLNKNKELKGKYKIVITDDENADISVKCESEAGYTKFAYSPYIVLGGSKEKLKKALVKSGVMLDSPYNDDYVELDFSKVINEVIEEGLWENLGVSDMNQIKIFYPSKDSKYRKSFYDFMLVTANNGTYPQNEEELEDVTRIVELFEKSKCTEPISDFEKKLRQIGEFSPNILFVVPEEFAFELYSATRFPCRLFFPTETVYCNYYFKANTELGMKVMENYENSKFFAKLKEYKYRSDAESQLYFTDDYVNDERNVYNVVNVPE